jgi:signal transduction histidine kinase
MRAATFWSKSPPTETKGYPQALATAIVSIAIATCMMANGLLAHAATVSRNKLAEIVWTRKKLWRTIAQKENAEAAAAARSDFIASASHEIRTPLHHLQGYSDLLSQTELTEEGRLLLSAIQRATKTLSLSKLQNFYSCLYSTC